MCFRTRLNLSWSNWGFGMEALADSAARLEKAGIRFIELHGNHYGPDLGYKPKEALKVLGDHGIAVASICGMFSPDNDLSSNRAIQRQAAVDYLRREIAFTAAVGGGYILVVPGAVGRPHAYDASEFQRSVETLRIVADDFKKSRIVMPSYDRIAAFAKAHGVPVVSVDSDGMVDELVPLMMKHGVNSFMPFEVQAGCDIEVFREQYPMLGIMGGLDKRALAKDRKAMHHELDRAERMLVKGGWIPGFDHLIPPDVPWDNFNYFMQALRKMIR